ncbi:DUF6893 family small protein [Streptomyces sp. NPDC060048]
MKKAVICGVAAAALLAVLQQILPDIKRYLHMRRM